MKKKRFEDFINDETRKKSIYFQLLMAQKPRAERVRRKPRSKEEIILLARAIRQDVDRLYTKIGPYHWVMKMK